MTTEIDRAPSSASSYPSTTQSPSSTQTTSSSRQEKQPSSSSSNTTSPQPPSTDSTIQVTRRSDRSLLTRLIYTALRAYRPIGQALSSPGDPYPPGSPRLTPNASWTDGCTLTEREVEGIYIYDLVRCESEDEDTIATANKESHTDEAHLADNSHPTSPEIERRIYFVAGGSWRQPPTKEHWKFVAKLARLLPRTALSVVSVPLAPAETAPTVYPRLLALYARVMADAEERGERIVWAGDSSGGNIVLALVGEVLRVGRRGDKKTAVGVQGANAGETESVHEWEADERGSLEEREHIAPLPAPAALMLICPSVDAKRGNPEIEGIREVDPVLDADESQRHAAEWAGAWGLEDERVSPVLGEKEDHVVRLLRERGIHVHGVTAGHDILGPDGVKLRNLLAKEGVKGKWLEWDKMMHCFSLAWFYGLPESKGALQWIVDVLREE